MRSRHLIRWGRLVPGAAFVALVLSACGQVGNPAPSAFPSSVSRGGAHVSQQYLFVNNRVNSTQSLISFYNIRTPNKESGSIPTGNLYSILASGPDGNVYAGQDGYKLHSVVAVYDGKNGTLLRTITRGVAYVLALALDQSGTLYVANRQSVTIYPNGQSKHMRKIVTYPKAQITGIAVDPIGDLYVATYSQIYVYATGSNTPKEVITSNVYDVQALGLDTSGNLFVSSIPQNSSCGEVAVFNPGQTAPAYVIPAAENACVWYSFAAAPNGNMYAVTGGQNGIETISAYAYGQTSPALVINRGLDDPSSILFDAGGNLYVADYGKSEIQVYSPGQTKAGRKITEGISGPGSMSISSASKE